MEASDDDRSTGEAGPSRSQRRREALDTLALAELLVAAPPATIARMDLPAEVADEIPAVRRITSYGARKRQLAYLAKLMRRHDDEAFAAARAALGTDREQQRRENAVLHRLEALRQRLLDDDEALTALIEKHPQVDRQQLRGLVRRARTEAGSDKPPRASRELFRLLRSLEAAAD
ncbi:MAG TPA: ribosome biogenesis factor YjgA [Rhodanobacteraceae bacterium]|nr:ribosome biogenesis factor YjgA [Rhodanobacteraceae bacterium]